MVGFAGVCLVLGPWDLAAGHGDRDQQVLGQLAGLGATSSYGLAGPVLRRPTGPAHLAGARKGAVIVLAGVAVTQGRLAGLPAR